MRNPFRIGAYAAECLTLAVAHESISRDAADAGGGTNPMAEAEPNPWLDMGDDQVIRRPDPPPLAMMCTECETRHFGVCTSNDLLRTQMHWLEMYATKFLPHGPDFFALRAELYALADYIYSHLGHGEVPAETYIEVHAKVVILIERCGPLVPVVCINNMIRPVLPASIFS